MNNTAKPDLKWQKFKVLDDGFICLVDIMGDDYSVTQAARVSYGQDPRSFDELDSDLQNELINELKSKNDPSLKNSNAEELKARCMGLFLDKSKESNRRLLRYLLRQRHTTPFEMVELKFLVRVPMDCWRQWIRTRTASVNEYSTRYSKAIDSQQKTKPNEWRLQAKNNKQGSEGFLPEDYDGKIDEPLYGKELSKIEESYHKEAAKVYNDRIEAGIAKEQARKDLPLSTYTEAYWKIDLHNLLNFLSLRMDSHAQKEIRDYATIIGEKIIAELLPETWQAFLDYRFNSLNLSALDMSVIRKSRLRMVINDADLPDDWKGMKRCRERDEFFDKLEKMGISVTSVTNIYGV